jgi:hypothetical protein
MSALPLVLVLLLVGCAPGAAGGARDGVPTAEAPFTLTALDVRQPTFPFRGQNIRILRFRQPQRSACRSDKVCASLGRPSGP